MVSANLNIIIMIPRSLGGGEAGVAQDENPACFGIKQETAKLKYGMVYMQGK